MISLYHYYFHGAQYTSVSIIEPLLIQVLEREIILLMSRNCPFNLLDLSKVTKVFNKYSA